MDGVSYNTLDKIPVAVHILQRMIRCPVHAVTLFGSILVSVGHLCLINKILNILNHGGEGNVILGEVISQDRQLALLGHDVNWSLFLDLSPEIIGALSLQSCESLRLVKVIHLCPEDRVAIELLLIKGKGNSTKAGQDKEYFSHVCGLEFGIQLKFLFCFFEKTSLEAWQLSTFA